MSNEKRRQYAKDSSTSLRFGVVGSGFALILTLVSMFSNLEFEFTAIMVMLFSITLFLIANYQATAASVSSETTQESDR